MFQCRILAVVQSRASLLPGPAVLTSAELLDLANLTDGSVARRALVLSTGAGSPDGTGLASVGRLICAEARAALLALGPVRDVNVPLGVLAGRADLRPGVAVLPLAAGVAPVGVGVQLLPPRANPARHGSHRSREFPSGQLVQLPEPELEEYLDISQKLHSDAAIPAEVPEEQAKQSSAWS